MRPADRTEARRISFEEAATAFEDKLDAYYPDTLVEARFILIGYSQRHRLLYVVHAEVFTETIRIISARKATKHEKRTTKTIDVIDGEVDFVRFGPVRRNAFSGAGERGGPSLLALWEMPEVASDVILLRRGHPGKGKQRRTVVRSLRLPDS